MLTLLKNTTIGGVPVNTNYLSHSSNYTAKLTNRTLEYIVLHYTGNVSDLAINNCKYFQIKGRKASAHFFVDEKNIYQSVSIKHIAWHCGTDKGYKTSCRNDNSIGVEMCCSGNYKVSAATQNLTIKTLAYLFKQLGWTKKDVDKRLLRHYDVGKNNKKCPAQFVDNPNEWTSFKNALKKELGAVNLQQYGCALNMIDHLQIIPVADKKKGETVSTAAKTYKWSGRYPDAISNAELFEKKNGELIAASGSVVQKVNELLADVNGIGIKNGTTPLYTYKNQAKADDWLGGYPTLIANGKIAFTSVPSGLGGERGRTAIAFNNTHFAFFWVKEEDGCDLFAFADAILEKGFTYAINLDGGGSTSFITPGVAYEQNRKVRNKFGLWVKNGTGNKLAKNSTTSTTNVFTGPSNPAASSGGMLQDASKAKGVKLTVIAKNGLNLRASAPSGTVKSVIPYGEKINWYGYYTICNSVKWYYVQRDNGTTGYVSSEFVK